VSVLTLAPPVCPRHGLSLSGGPVAFHCDGGTGHGHEVHAADLDVEVTA
jgi:hypothetical protein